MSTFVHPRPSLIDRILSHGPKTPAGGAVFAIGTTLVLWAGIGYGLYRLIILVGP